MGEIGERGSVSGVYFGWVKMRNKVLGCGGILWGMEVRPKRAKSIKRAKMKRYATTFSRLGGFGGGAEGWV